MLEDKAEIDMIQKDHTYEAAIEKQDAGSNVCAFTATFFLSLAIAELARICRAEKAVKGVAERTDLEMKRQSALAAYLTQLAVSKSKYEKRRRLSMLDLSDLCKRYAKHCAKKREQGEAEKGKAEEEEE